MEAVALHPVCHTCRAQQRGEWTRHELYSPGLDRYFQTLVASAVAGAKSRGISFLVEKDDVLGAFLEQNGKCAMTGLPMDWMQKGKVGRGKRALMAPSIDRIDSGGNYTVDNIQIVLTIVNLMKGTLTVEQFRQICRRVSEYELESAVGITTV